MREIKGEELKIIQVDILNHIDSVCKENNIEYFLIAGSLIGAIRHQGFIPWDDDIDIALTKSNYDKLLECLKKENGKYLLLDHSVQQDYYYPYAKLVNTDTTMIEEKFKPIKNYGVYVDIFYYTGLPDEARKRKKAYKKIKNNQRLIFCYGFNKIDETRIIKRIIKQIIKIYTNLIGIDKILAKNRKINEMYNIEQSKYAISNWPIYRREHEIQESKNLKGVEKHKFENLMVNIPKNYDKILTTSFGDYMTPPPPEKRISNHKMRAYLKD